MKKEQVSWLLSFHIFFLFSTTNNTVSVNGQCLSDQRSYLSTLKNSLQYELQYSSKLVQWNPDEDCCSWKGVGCDPSGRVTSLDLSDEGITGAADNLTNLFRLRFLEKLNLGFNSIPSIPIPTAFANLTKLVYLNMSNSDFGGQIPIELSSLRNLVSLDLSTHFIRQLKVESPSLKMLLQNLSNIEKIYLDGIDLSALGNQWSQVIATSLPKLRTLSLRSCNLVGKFPLRILQVLNLHALDISDNELLQGSLPPFSKNSSLRKLVLSSTSFSGSLPSSIGNLHMLSMIDLSYCKFNGTIPASFQDLLKLSHVDLSHNNFSGSIPRLQSFKNLVFMSLSDNSLTGSLFSNHFEGLLSLEGLYLGNNFLSGSLPSTLFKLPALTVLDLRLNQFSGQIDEIRDTLTVSRTPLEDLYLSSNQLSGSFPKFLFKLKELKYLALSSNSFTDIIPLETLKNLPNLERLDLSCNNLIEPQTNNSTLAELSMLKLASCKLYSFPDTKSRAWLFDLDLSDYKTTGGIPNWLWNLGQGNLSQVVSSINLSNNKLSGCIPESIGDLKALHVLDLSHNEITGGIPSSIGKLGNLGSLDLSRNQLSGEIPSTLGLLNFLSHLNLSFNIQLTGKIPTGSQLQTFSNDSYIGNVGLCGFPVNVECGNANGNGSSSIPSLSNKKEIDWMYICASVGYAIGLGIFSMLLLFCAGWRNKLFFQIDQLLAKVFGPKWKEPIRRL